MNKIWIIVRKEWSEVFKNRIVFFAVAFMPLLFTAIPLIMLYSMGTSGGGAASALGDIPPEFSQYCEGVTGIECMQSFILTQFLVLFLIMPVIIPATIASYSIVGEKTRHTLEPLLATPVTTIQLLSGKALAAGIPAMAATWGSYLIFVVGTVLILGAGGVFSILLKPLWLIAIFIVGPLLAVSGIAVAIMVSSRVNDPRVAEQLSALVVLPLIAIFMGQIFGFLYLDETVILWVSLGLLILDVGLLYLSVQFFQRENILTRWK